MKQRHKTERFNMRLTPKTAEQLAVLAEIKKTNQTDVVETLIDIAFQTLPEAHEARL